MTKNLLKISVFLILTASALVSCSPEDGVDGTNGTNGTNGVDGTDGLNSLIRTMIEQPGAVCVNGGFKVETGLDTNSNGQLDATEITDEQYLCNGSDSDSSFKNYVSLISQTGTNDPSSTILENSLELDVVWVRETQGKYVGTLSEPIDMGRTVIFYTTPTTHTGVRGEIIADNQVRMELQNGINVFQDNFTNLSFELREYE